MPRVINGSPNCSEIIYRMDCHIDGVDYKGIRAGKLGFIRNFDNPESTAVSLILGNLQIIWPFVYSQPTSVVYIREIEGSNYGPIIACSINDDLEFKNLHFQSGTGEFEPLTNCEEQTGYSNDEVINMLVVAGSCLGELSIQNTVTFPQVVDFYRRLAPLN